MYIEIVFSCEQDYGSSSRSMKDRGKHKRYTTSECRPTLANLHSLGRTTNQQQLCTTHLPEFSPAGSLAMNQAEKCHKGWGAQTSVKTHLNLVNP